MNSGKAIQMNIAGMRKFVEVRNASLKQNTLLDQLQQIKDRFWEYDTQLNRVYPAMKNLINEKAKNRKKKKDWFSEIKNLILKTLIHEG